MDHAQQLIDAAPGPDASELRRRRDPLRQFARFVVLGWRMFTMAQGH